jgi:hypothetical protein
MVPVESLRGIIDHLSGHTDGSRKVSQVVTQIQESQVGYNNCTLFCGCKFEVANEPRFSTEKDYDAAIPFNIYYSRDTKTFTFVFDNDHVSEAPKGITFLYAKGVAVKSAEEELNGLNSSERFLDFYLDKCEGIASDKANTERFKILTSFSPEFLKKGIIPYVVEDKSDSASSKLTLPSIQSVSTATPMQYAIL